MSAYTFLRDDAETPTLWRPLDRALAQWVRAHGGSALLAHVAGWTSYADGMGDAALPLRGERAGRHGEMTFDAAAIAALRDEAMVGDGSASAPIKPFVLDAQDRFALNRNHADEVAIAAHIAALRSAPPGWPAATVAQELAVLFDAVDARASLQREAVRQAATRRFFVLSGGPGTGKTSTVLRLLLLRLRLAGATPPTLRVAAPTGKAAQRLVQALRRGKQALRSTLPADWQPLLEHIPDSDAATVHRLLGYDPTRNVYTRGTTQPLAADIVVVDEASMLDLTTLRALLDALRPGASLILVGDADQLTSIATGSVLADIVNALEVLQAPELVQLTYGFRAEPQLAEVNRAVRVGDAVALGAMIDAAPTQIHRWEIDDETALRRRLRDWAQQLALLPLRPRVPPAAAVAADIALPASIVHPARSRRGASRRVNQDQSDLFQVATAAPADVALGALRALTQQQLLCALREERFGALAANALIEAELKRQWQVREDEVWYAGRAIIVTRNDYAIGLYNGDVGVCLKDADDELAVWFDSVDEHGNASARAVPVDRLPAHESAFAITIHKSQGSEYDRVAVLLPPHAEHRVLSRQLLYTGVSRARHALELWATSAALEAALDRPVVRVGALADRVRKRPET